MAMLENFNEDKRKNSMTQFSDFHTGWSIFSFMKKLIEIITIVIFSIALHSNVSAQIFDPVQWRMEYELISETEGNIIVWAEIEENWHIYSIKTSSPPIPTSFAFNDSIPAYKLEGEIEEIGNVIESYDKIFEKQVGYYDREIAFKQKIKTLSSEPFSIDFYIEFQACDQEKCLPPQKERFSQPMNGLIAQDDRSESKTTDAESILIANLDLERPISNCIEKQAATEFGIWHIFILGFLGGLIALLTPCVFPMIPLTVSFFTKGSVNKKKGIFNALLYGFFIFFIYLLLSLPFHFLDSLAPEILNTISTNIWLNLFFFIIFLFFAFSFFGYYEFILPSKWTSQTTKGENLGGIIGIFFMALTLAIVSFSCTGPILGSLLVGSITSDGGAYQLTAGMGGFGLALALPFALFALFPNWLQSLPKSGGWLNTIKVVLGFIELALALKFLSNADLVAGWGMLNREIFIGLWFVIFIGLGIYALGKIKFPHDSPNPKIGTGRLMVSLFSFAFAIYLSLGLFPNKYSNLKLISGFPPPMFYSFYGSKSDCPLGLKCFKDYEEGMAYAKSVNKPVMLDFTGWACVNCRRMEENVWSDSEIFNIIDGEYILISLYVDDRKELSKEEQTTVKAAALFSSSDVNGRQKKIETIGDRWATFQTLNFKNNSQPHYVLLNPDGTLLTHPVGYVTKSEYKEFLNCGLIAFRSM